MMFTLAESDGLERLNFSNAYMQGNLVIVLCAAWCGTCNGFKEVAQSLGEHFTNTLFIWLDVEDDADVVGDIDVMNFPSLAVFREGVAVHYGVSLPHQGVVKRLISALLTNPIQEADVPEEVVELPQRIQDRLAL